MTISSADVISFWTHEVGESRWYNSDAALDARMRQRFSDLWQSAKQGELAGWQDDAEGALALVLVLDQFPRNMFRDTADSFATDAQAREVTAHAIDQGFDMKIEPPLREFFYMPFMHSESIADQDRSVALIGERLGKDSQQYPYAMEHRAEIARFGRFPSRNNALGRTATAEEHEFLVIHKKSR